MSKENNQIKTKNLNIIAINVNSIISKDRRYDLELFVNTHKPDVVLLNETKLNNKHKLSFYDYNIIRKDRIGSKQGGGTAVLIKKDIKFSTHDNFKLNKLKVLEACAIKVPLTSNKVLHIVSVYYPSGSNDSTMKNDLSDMFESMQLDNINNYYVIAGDFNARHTNWGNPNNNSKGIKLSQWIAENEILMRCTMSASNKPSFARANSFIDLCVHDNRLKISKTNDSINGINTIDYDSDHNALQFEVSFNSLKEFSFFKDNKPIAYNFKATNWRKFNNHLLSLASNKISIPNNKNIPNEQIDFYLDELNSIIVNTIKSQTPKYKNTNFTEKLSNTIIKKLRLEKSRVLTIIKKHQRLENTLTDSEFMLHKAQLKNIKKLISEHTNMVFNKIVEEKLSNIDPKHSKSMFNEIKQNYKRFEPLKINMLKISKSASNFLNNTNIQNLDEYDDDNYIISNKRDILNTIGAYMQDVHSVKITNEHNNIHREVNTFFDIFNETKAQFEGHLNSITVFNDINPSDAIEDNLNKDVFINIDDLLLIFRNLRGKLSSGDDLIPNIVLKHLPYEVINEYCKIFNNLINNSYFPIKWKNAKIVLLPKKDKDSTDVKNIRPISLLPNISKIFEICLKKKIELFCLQNSLVSEKQFGFKYKHSTTDAIHLVTSNICWNWNKNLCTGACLIDMEKAFDSVWIPGLIFKLVKYKFPFCLIILIYNMISEKTFKVYHQNLESSHKFKINNGLQQGAVNSPVLFNLYLLDLLNRVSEIVSFADDIIIYHSGKTVENININLQNKFDVVEKYTIDWNLKINPKKSEAIMFRPPVNLCSNNIKQHWKDFCIISKYSNNTIPQKATVKYLGVYLDKFLYFNKHVDLILIKARNAFFKYKCLFYSKYLQTRVKIIMYQVLIRPIISYACPIWYNISPSYMEKIRVFERKCLRACTRLYRAPSSNYKKYISNQILYNEAKIIRIDNFIISLIRNNILRATSNTENNLILAPYYTNDLYIMETLKTGFVPPEAFLFLDKMGLIQNPNNIPIFYHNYRRANVKKVNFNDNNINWRFDASISNSEINLRRFSNARKYWWL